MPCVINLAKNITVSRVKVHHKDVNLFAESGYNVVKFIFRYFSKIDYTFS